MIPSSGGVGCGEISLLLLADDSRRANSKFCLESGLPGIEWSPDSDKRSARSELLIGRMTTGCPDGKPFGEIEIEPPRGLCDRRFGDGVSGGLPGNEGAHTICSGLTD